MQKGTMADTHGVTAIVPVFSDRFESAITLLL